TRSVSKIIDASYERAVSLLTEHRDKLTALAESLLEKEVIGSDDLIRVLGERPFSKSVDYDEFVNASWKRKLETADDAGEDAGGGGGGGSGGGGGEELPPAQAAA
ncbi:hypothetical protein EMIHUDRAFT_445942, partial [Emiliania huxleyi CCMP1516]|uniref:Peptidase M41 domain-containing protein n=2 Tax=Emiliania huxleyi TaxID=2903 RepID=A0A0D3IND2_EMIH1